MHRHTVALALWALICTAIGALAQGPAATTGKLYTPEQIRQMSVEELFARMSQPELDYRSGAATQALKMKAQTDAATRDRVLAIAIAIAKDTTRQMFERSQAFYIMADIGDTTVVPVLAEILKDADTAVAVRSAAACALGRIALPTAGEVLKRAATEEKSEEVLKWINQAIELKGQATQIESHRQVRIWLVKDWIRLHNSGPTVSNVEFRRFFPVVDDEQIILGRWIEAHQEKDTAVPVSLVRVDSDSDDNPIHTIRVGGIPQGQDVVVTITAVVARHARRSPKPPYDLPKPDEYPDDIKPYLSRTTMVPVDDPKVRQQAQELLAQNRDAFKIVSGIIAILNGLPRNPKEKSTAHPELSIPAFTLRYGGWTGQSAVMRCTPSSVQP